jgi:hypothetical protein
LNVRQPIWKDNLGSISCKLDVHSWAPWRQTFWLENLPLQSTELYKKVELLFHDLKKVGNSWATWIALSAILLRNWPLISGLVIEKQWSYIFEENCHSFAKGPYRFSSQSDRSRSQSRDMNTKPVQFSGGHCI